MAEDDDYDDNINYKSISCEQIPELFLDKLVAKKHFSKFGKINRFVLRPSRLCCTVDYESESDAANAYEEAGTYNGHDFIVNYAEKEVAHVQNTEEWVDPDVQAELESMGAMNKRSSSVASHMRQSILKQTFPPPTSSLKSSLPPPPSRSAQRLAAPKPLAPTSSATSASSSSSAAALPRVDASVRLELESLLRRPAYTDEDKYRTLDARDKLIRLTTVRQTDIKKAVRTKGFCPDMCPEKERLMREFQRQVSNFEQSNNSAASSTISHRCAIKEYSRSSADQEVPLSHELRSEQVLHMTMQYLMHHILDLCDDAQTSLADWFHFVWDRTRSIRKDITQQELCSLGAVQLVEQCARFHIHCAARLVAEDPAVFDKKINAENLTKCLQTLKYMYHDLRIKNVLCPCESEFRGYIVLLNLGDANFLWELKQLPHEIQNSAHIKRSIAFYNALQNNNYVRFFDMIRAPETSYLSACILLGYFTKLRVKAMIAIIKSHNWRKTAVSLPLSYLTHVLGFEDAVAAQDFFRCHGLHCDEERVTLDRLVTPDMEYCMERAKLLVESKRLVSVGECVCGKPLDTLDSIANHQPHNSFDSNGLLRVESWTADDQLRGAEATAKRLKPQAAATTSIQQQQSQQQQRGSSSSAQYNTAQQKSTPPPDNIFKVPLASPPISPKQQQQHQQNANKFTATPLTASGASIFGNKNFSTASEKSSPQFGIDNNKYNNTPPSSSVFGSSGNSSTDSTQSLFKMPPGSMAIKEPSTEATSATDFFKSIFKPTAASVTPMPTAGSIFGSANSFKQSTTPSAAGGNIFGAAAKETANIFQQQQQQPMQSDNIFQHFQMQQPSISQSKSVFGAVAAKTSNAEQQSLQTQQQLEALERKRQLVEQERHKLAEIAEERRKLQLLEEKQQRIRDETERQRRLKAFEQRVERETARQLETLLIEEVQRLAVAELAQQQAFERRTLQLTQQLIEEVVRAQVEEIQNEEYALMCHDQLLQQRYFERWLQVWRKRRAARQLMQTTPRWMAAQTREQQTQQVAHPRAALNMRQMQRYRLGVACDWRQLLVRRETARQATLQRMDLHKLLLQQGVATAEGSGVQRRRYFKMLLTLPGERQEAAGFEALCNRWLNKYIRRNTVEQEEEDDAERDEDDEDDSEAEEGADKSNATEEGGKTKGALKKVAAADKKVTEAGGPFINSVAHNVALCVRKLSGAPALNESRERARHEANHADAVIMLLSGDNLPQMRQRLHQLLKLSENLKPLPLALIAFNCDVDENILVQALQLRDLQQQHKISHYYISGCQQRKSEFNFARAFTKATQFIAKCATDFESRNTKDTYEMQPLLSWLELTLGEQLWQRWHHSSRTNPAFGKVCRLPHELIKLYNETLQRLQQLLLLTDDVQQAPEFPTELLDLVPPLQHSTLPVGLEYFPRDWKNPLRCQSLLQLLQKFKLPALEEQMSQTDVEELELQLLNYASRCLPADERAATQVAFDAIQSLIAALNAIDMQPLEIAARLPLVCWLPLLKPLAFARINDALQQPAVAQQLPQQLIYRRDAFHEFQEQPWWLNVAAVAAVSVDYTLPVAKPAIIAAQQQHLTQQELAQEMTRDMQRIMQQAEQTSLRAEQQLQSLKLKAGKVLQNEATRALDESLYEFELARKCGAYIAAVPKDIDEFEDEEDGAVGGCAVTSPRKSPLGQKRRRAKDDDVDGKHSEMDDIMAKAFALIAKVERMEDEEQRLQQRKSAAKQRRQHVFD